MRKQSFSESSDSDGYRRRVRSRTITSNSKDILEKQMLEMIAREARERELLRIKAEQQEQQEKQQRKRRSSCTPMTPERDRESKSRSRAPSVAGSTTDYHGSAEKSGNEKGAAPAQASQQPTSPQRQSRPSLEVPTGGHGHNRRPSIDMDSSLPNSPELRAISGRDSGFVPPIGIDLSPPSSRPASPTRNPFRKVKNAFRDRSRDRAAYYDHQRHDLDERDEEQSEQRQTLLDENAELAGGGPGPVVVAMSHQLRDRSREPVAGPGRRPASVRPDGQERKGHRPHGSVRLRGDETTGIRALFRGSRLDGIIRGGISRVGEMLAASGVGVSRQQQRASAAAADADGLSSSTSTDNESELDKNQGQKQPQQPTTRGRKRLSRANSQRSAQEGMQSIRSRLETLPAFVSTVETRHEKTSSVALDPSLLSPQLESLSRSPSRRASRFELLKPPKIDVHSVSTSAEPPVVVTGSAAQQLRLESETSDTDRSRAAHVKETRLGSIVAMPSFLQQQSQQHQSKAGSASVSNLGGRTDDDHASRHHGGPRLSRREVARIRALLLSSGIKAMEIARRANEPRVLVGPAIAVKETGASKVGGSQWTGTPPMDLGQKAKETDLKNDNEGVGDTSSQQQQQQQLVPWPVAVASLAPADQTALLSRAVPQAAQYALAAQLLSASVDASSASLQVSLDEFTSMTVPSLQQRAALARRRAANDVSQLVRTASDDADDAARDLVVKQRLKVRKVEEAIGRLARRRRRRFRWIRRAGWLAVEWLLVGFMWYVWFVVMIARVVWSTGKGVLRGVRWLLWL